MCCGYKYTHLCLRPLEILDAESVNSDNRNAKIDCASKTASSQRITRRHSFQNLIRFCGKLQGTHGTISDILSIAESQKNDPPSCPGAVFLPICMHRFVTNEKFFQTLLFMEGTKEGSNFSLAPDQSYVFSFDDQDARCFSPVFTYKRMETRKRKTKHTIYPLKPH
jgi:hypothetical protein